MRSFVEEGVPVQAVVTQSLERAYPQICRSLDSEKLVRSRVNQRNPLSWVRILLKSRAVVTACDCNVEAHRHGYRFIRVARALRIPTFTLQHGLENIGLNYSDEEYPLERVRFASDFVLTWGTPEMFDPRLPNCTRKKIQPVGILRDIPRSILPPVRRICVFENLHWGRYSSAYRTAFVEHLKEILEGFQDYEVSLKPHSAGNWSSALRKEDWVRKSRLEILDPRDPGCPRALDLIHGASLVITTPSTIAVDASLSGVPVGVVAGEGLPLSRYEPLPLLLGEWKSLVGRVVEQEYPLSVLNEFIERNSVSRSGIHSARAFILEQSR